MNNAILSKAVLHLEHTVLMIRNALNAAIGCTWGRVVQERICQERVAPFLQAAERAFLCSRP